MTRGALSLTLLAALACRQSPVAAQSPRRAPAVAAPSTSPARDAGAARAAPTTTTSGVTRSMVEPVCGSPREAALRREMPGLPACNNRGVFTVGVTLGGRPARVAAWEADPCCTDVGGAQYRAGARAWSTGRALEELSSAGALARGATRDERQAALQAALLEAGATRQAVTEAEVAALIAAHPEAATALRREPPGWLSANELRVWATREEHERGVSCWILEPRVAVVEASGAVRARAAGVSYGVGSRMGEPCGAPLP